MTASTLPTRAIGPVQQLVCTPGELRVGDVAHCAGMRVLVVDAPQLSRAHAGGRTYWTRGEVLNRAELSSDAVPYAFTANGDGTHGWTLQGNDLAREYVERAPVAL